MIYKNEYFDGGDFNFIIILNKYTPEFRLFDYERHKYYIFLLQSWNQTSINHINSNNIHEIEQFYLCVCTRNVKAKRFNICDSKWIEDFILYVYLLCEPINFLKRNRNCCFSHFITSSNQYRQQQYMFSCCNSLVCNEVNCLRANILLQT